MDPISKIGHEMHMPPVRAPYKEIYGSIFKDRSVISGRIRCFNRACDTINGKSPYGRFSTHPWHRSSLAYRWPPSSPSLARVSAETYKRSTENLHKSFISPSSDTKTTTWYTVGYCGTTETLKKLTFFAEPLCDFEIVRRRLLVFGWKLLVQ